jgi:hypothetical protein
MATPLSFSIKGTARSVPSCWGTAAASKEQQRPRGSRRAALESPGPATAGALPLSAFAARRLAAASGRRARATRRPNLQVARAVQGVVPESRPREFADDVLELRRRCRTPAGGDHIHDTHVPSGGAVHSIKHACFILSSKRASRVHATMGNGYARPVYRSDRDRWMEVLGNTLPRHP